MFWLGSPTTQISLRFPSQRSKTLCCNEETSWYSSTVKYRYWSLTRSTIEVRSSKIAETNNKISSKTEDQEDMISLYTKTVKENKYEISYIACNFFIDFVNVAPFKEKNEEKVDENYDEFSSDNSS